MMNATKREIRQMGTYQTREGEKYYCLFLPDAKIALAVGPCRVSDSSTGVKGDVCIDASSEEEAREGMRTVLGSGDFV